MFYLVIGWNEEKPESYAVFDKMDYALNHITTTSCYPGCTSVSFHVIRGTREKLDIVDVGTTKVNKR